MYKNLYLTRDEGWGVEAEVDIWYRKPKKRDRTYGYNTAWLDSFCYRMFLKATGFKLKPGECKRVRITVEEMEATHEDDR